MVQVDPDNAILEKDTGNNEAQLSVAVQEGNAFVSERYFSPDGDGVQDTTQLFFRLDQAADVAIEIRDRRDRIVRRHSSAELSNVMDGYFEWDGLDDRGTLVADGDYRLQVVGSGGNILGEAVTTLDTNRSSLLEAAGTPFELTTNLTCLLPDISDLQLTANEEHFFFFIESTMTRNRIRCLPTAFTGWRKTVAKSLNWFQLRDWAMPNIFRAGTGA